MAVVGRAREGNVLKILFFYYGVDPNWRSNRTFPYALTKHADVKYYGQVAKEPGKVAYTIEEKPTEKSRPWQTYGHLVRHGKLSESIDALEIIQKIYPNDYPDAVVTFFDPDTFPAIKNFGKCKCLRVVWSIEVHNTFSQSEQSRRKLQWCTENVDLVFKPSDPNNRLEQSKRLKATGVAVEMNIPSINTDFFYDKQLPKKYDVANLFGINIPAIYPLRWEIREKLRTQKKWSYREPASVWIKGKRLGIPGIPVGTIPRGEKYVNAICQSRVFATGSGMYRADWGVLVMKWLEVPACNTLLMINKLTPTDDMDAMGFKPDVNFVAINKNNFLERIQYYLSHPSEAKTIAQRGYDLIRSKHSQNIRANEFIAKIRKYL